MEGGETGEGSGGAAGHGTEGSPALLSEAVPPGHCGPDISAGLWSKPGLCCHPQRGTCAVTRLQGRRYYHSVVLTMRKNLSRPFTDLQQVSAGLAVPVLQGYCHCLLCEPGPALVSNRDGDIVLFSDTARSPGVGSGGPGTPSPGRRQDRWPIAGSLRVSHEPSDLPTPARSLR